tara:strand:+ start:2116 stop:2430 length:315 start_codon:yes stop_codon:yes gene_type:complete
MRQKLRLTKNTSRDFIWRKKIIQIINLRQVPVWSETGTSPALNVINQDTYQSMTGAAQRFALFTALWQTSDTNKGRNILKVFDGLMLVALVIALLGILAMKYFY